MHVAISVKSRLFKGALVFALCLLAVSGAGCSVKKLAMNMISDALSGDGGTVFAGDDDPQLIGDALPFALKLYESLLEKNPNHTPLLLATGKAYAMYAYAFVQFPADTLPDEMTGQQTLMRRRAKKLYLRGRDYVFRALEVRHPGFAQKIRGRDIDSALFGLSAGDTAYLYWAGMAWMGAITSNKFDLGMMMAMPKAVALIRKSHEFNEGFGRGSTHEFFLSYYASMPPSMGGNEEKARHHFARALELAKGSKAGPYVSLASTVCVKKQDRGEFERLLGSALAIDPDAQPQDRLANVLAQQKARWMLNHADRYFLAESGAEEQ